MILNFCRAAVVTSIFFALLTAEGHAQGWKSRAVDNEKLILAATRNDSEKSLEAFFATLRLMESDGNYRAVNTLNFIGAYQFGEAALVDLGYVRRDRDLYDNNYGGGFRGKDGIRSISDFLNSPRIQDKAAKAWLRLMWRYIEEERLSRYAWKRVGEITLTPSGMLGATHLLGTGGLRDFIRSGGSSNVRDPYGTPIARYVKRLADYHIPFAPAKPRALASLD